MGTPADKYPVAHNLLEPREVLQESSVKEVNPVMMDDEEDEEVDLMVAAARRYVLPYPFQVYDPEEIQVLLNGNISFLRWESNS